jgi:biotin-dependent carboxylase-like uncharacterized protein
MITLLHQGVYCSIQDLGRKGFANIGVPVSGVMDATSAKLGNQLLSNDLNEAVLEIAFGGVELQFDEDTIVCLTGADFSPKINGVRIEMNAVIKIKKSQTITFGKRNYGVRTYLSVFGGIQAKEILSSKSFYKEISGKIILQKGDVVPCKTLKGQTKQTYSKIKVDERHFSTNGIRCFKGPEFELLTKTQQAQLFGAEFIISNDNNRVGYRLNEPIENTLKPILTSGVLPGTVQLTPSGKLIILMRDCQVTGGYPRVLQVSEESINRLAQKTTQDKIQFVLK